MLRQLAFPKEAYYIFLSIFLFAVTMGIDVVVFPAALTKHGIPASKVGIALACEAIGSMIMSFFLGKLVAQLSIRKTLRYAAIGYASAITLIYFCYSFYLWAAMAFLMGICWFTYVIVRQSWLNILISSEQRGVALGIFSMTISAGFAVGPIIAKFSGATSYLTFLLSATIALTSLYALKPLNKIPQPVIESKRIPLWQFFKKNPHCFLGRFFLDFQVFILITLTVIFGRKIGLSYEASGLLITAYMASGFLDVYIGFLLKKLSPYHVMNVGFFVCMYAFIAIIFYQQSYSLLLLLYFTFGLGVACIYVSVFKIANDDYSKEQLIAANATFQLIGTTGSIFGCILGGYFLDIFGSQGLPIAVILGCLAYTTFVVVYEKKFKAK